MKTLIVICSVIAATALAVQDDQPYRGQEKRSIKALSEADVEGLLEGKGMGLAKAAELNAYPGPMHVLQLKTQLKLTPSQEKRTTAVMAAMRAKAKALGRQIVDSERELDAQFAAGKASPEASARLVRKIGALQGELRWCHLAAHLEMKAVLSKWQIGEYSRLRGYGGDRD